jgi:hypothetical protein
MLLFALFKWLRARLLALEDGLLELQDRVDRLEGKAAK